MIKRFAFAAVVTFLFAGCAPHFINDQEYRVKVEQDFARRESIFQASGIEISAMNLQQDELEAMMFLYSYMPLGDVVNMDPSYYLQNYHLTEKALKEMPWGRTIPEREVRHFVLPVRVNNENLDASREVFFAELAPRVKGMSMKDAVLEVNHWCHEKAIYMPSDSRTSSPLATVKTAYGRCGEESTLLVAALRSVGIPARQVYTPRWAHTDSNHAWVEAWVDGQWCFLGACEPEPVLNLGWFNAPASRGLLMHTNVFGDYTGPEEVVRRTPIHTEINVIGNYAPKSASIKVKVLDTEGAPVEGAKVYFQIYNYSEFNSVAYRFTDAEGVSSLTAGLGDMMVYASDKGRFAFSKVTFGKESEVELKLEHYEGEKIPHLEMEVVPPVENAQLPEVSDELREYNTCRLEYEDSLRNAYVATFYTKEKAQELATVINLPAEDVAAIMLETRGNYTEIENFLVEAAHNGKAEMAMALLNSLSKKDLRDTPASVLSDHLYNTSDDADATKVLCPRVSTELITPYRAYLKQNIPVSLADTIRQEPASFVKWCKENFTLYDEISLRYVQLSPRRVWETRIADQGSREIFFVAACRTFGVPAWKDSVTGALKYENDGYVYDVDFNAEQQTVAPQGRIVLKYKEIPMLDDPKYGVHFSLSKFDGEKFCLLNYGKSATWSNSFKKPTMMDCGYYMLVSGSRMSGGNVFADVQFFTVEEGKTTATELVMRDIKDQIRVIGSFNSEAKYLSVPDPKSDERTIKSVLETTGRGYFAVALVDYGTEPTNHAFMDFSAAAKELEAWGRPILVVFASEEDYSKFRPEHFNLPSNVHFGIDHDGSMRKMIASEMKLDKGGRLPLIVLADTFNRVVFFSQGYSIGLGDRIVLTSKAL